MQSEVTENKRHTSIHICLPHTAADIVFIIFTGGHPSVSTSVCLGWLVFEVC